MSTMDRRIERLEQQSHLNRCEAWCCATEADAQALIARLRTESSPPPFVFIAGKSNSDRSPCWRIEGKRVADLWRAIDNISPGMPNTSAPVDKAPIDPRHDLTDQQLLGVIADSGSTLLLYPDDSYRLLESGAAL